MRIASGVTDQVVYFVAVDSTDLKTRETGLSSFTVYRSRNGGTATAMTTPTVTEVSSANMPGIYKLLLDEDMTIDAGDETQEMAFHITATGMAPVTRTIELYRPKITAGETLTSSSGAVTVGTNNDKTAYSLSQSFPTNFSSLAITAAGKVTVGTNDDKTGYTASTVSDKTGYSLTTAPLDAAGVRSAVGLASANLDTQLGDIPTATENADTLLKRDWTSVTGEAARSVLNALRALRNKVSRSGTTLTVTKEDDSTEAWTATLTTDSSAEPVTSQDPA